MKAANSENMYIKRLARPVAPVLLLVIATAASVASGVDGSARSVAATTPGDPASIIRAYYQSINRRQYGQAYSYLALPGRLPFQTWRRGYGDTEQVNVDELDVPGYHIREDGSAYTCAGVRLTAMRRGNRVVTYGGWYLAAETDRAWSIVLLGTRIAIGAKSRTPSWHTCLGEVPPPPFVGLSSLFFRDALHGWAGELSLTATNILRTSNGGATWQRLSVPAEISQLDFVDARNGWAFGVAPAGCLWDPRPPLPCRQVLLHTRDGGKSWREELRQKSVSPVESPVQFFDPKHGWLIWGRTGSTLLATSDGGRQWKRMFNTSLQLTSLHFVDLHHGWVGGSSTLGGSSCNTRVFSTGNGGRTWTRQLSRSLQCSPDVDFVNKNDGWLLAQPEVNQYCSMGGCGVTFLYRTTDGGRRWARLTQTSTGPFRSGFQTGVSFSTPQVGWIPEAGGAGPGLGGVNVTRNGGRTWTRSLTRYDVGGLTNVSLVNARKGWLVGCLRGPTGTSCDTLWSTVDGGLHWRRDTVK